MPSSNGAGRPATNRKGYNLTPRECDILRLMSDGLLKKEIGDALEEAAASLGADFA